MTVLSCCNKLFQKKDDELSISRRDYIGDQLRIDGYYYKVGYNGEINDGYWFFRNGILIHAGGIAHSFSKMDDLMMAYIKDGYYKTRKFAWGVFVIDGDDIAFERWYPHGPNQAYVRAGKILNKTTFRITESYRMVDGVKTEVREKDEMYYFRQFDFKPDSINRFIK